MSRGKENGKRFQTWFWFSSHGFQVTPRLSALARLGQGLRMCTSNKLPGSAAEAGQGTAL